jgi:Kelch motif
MFIRVLPLILLFAFTCQCSEWHNLLTEKSSLGRGCHSCVGGYFESLDGFLAYTGDEQMPLRLWQNGAWHDVKSSNVEPMPPSRDWGIAAANSQRYLYVYGGQRQHGGVNGTTRIDFGDLWQFGPVVDSDASGARWTKLYDDDGGVSLPAARWAANLAFVGDSLFLFGGNGRDRSRDDSVWRFDVERRQWTRMVGAADGDSDSDDEQRPRQSCCAGVGAYERSMFLFGGNQAHGDSNRLYRMNYLNATHVRWALLPLRYPAPPRRYLAGASSGATAAFGFGGTGTDGFGKEITFGDVYTLSMDLVVESSDDIERAWRQVAGNNGGAPSKQHPVGRKSPYFFVDTQSNVNMLNGYWYSHIALDDGWQLR